MSALEHDAPGGLDQVKELEGRLGDASGAHEAARARVARARERAERTVAEAHERAEADARRRREAALAEVGGEERRIRRSAAEQSEALIAALGGEREAAISAFVELVLPDRHPPSGR